MDICGYQYFLIFLHTRRYCEINLYSHILFQLIQLPWARTCLFLFGRNGVHLKAVRPCAARVLQRDAVCNWSKPQENCFPNNRDMAFSCGTWWLETARYLKTNLVWPYWMTDWLAPVWTPSIHFGYHPSARFQQTSYLDTSHFAGASLPMMLMLVYVMRSKYTCRTWVLLLCLLVLLFWFFGHAENAG